MMGCNWHLSWDFWALAVAVGRERLGGQTWQLTIQIGPVTFHAFVHPYSVWRAVTGGDR